MKNPGGSCSPFARGSGSENYLETSITSYPPARSWRLVLDAAAAAIMIERERDGGSGSPAAISIARFLSTITSLIIDELAKLFTCLGGHKANRWRPMPSRCSISERLAPKVLLKIVFIKTVADAWLIQVSGLTESGE